MHIAAARPDDAAALTAIAFAAKRHWGYPETWIRQWTGQLTISPAYLATHPTFAAWENDERLGFGAVQLVAGDAVLDHLWVLPAAMGRGVGRALFAHGEALARAGGATRLRITGDPHAEGFYRRMGATLCGRDPANMDGEERFLPRFEKAL